MLNIFLARHRSWECKHCETVFRMQSWTMCPRIPDVDVAVRSEQETQFVLAFKIKARHVKLTVMNRWRMLKQFRVYLWFTSYWMKLYVLTVWLTPRFSVFLPSSQNFLYCLSGSSFLKLLQSSCVNIGCFMSHLQSSPCTRAFSSRDDQCCAQNRHQV